MMNNDILKKQEQVQVFLENSEIKIQAKQKYQQIYIQRKAGGRTRETKWINQCKVFCRCWEDRYAIVTSEGIIYARGPQAAIREVIFFDYNFEMEYGKNATGHTLGIIFQTPIRKLIIKAENPFDFIEILLNVKLAYEQSTYVGIHRHDSFAPIRQNCFCQWYIDGENYFKQVCQALSHAKTEVFITDWWLTPHMYLQRPVSDDTNQEARLDRIIQQIAHSGVQVYIIMYREPQIALSNDSEFSQTSLEALSHNIFVLRHPNFLLPFMWSHHQKLVIIDQQMGFLGGLDLCYGRWDNSKHSLFEQNIETGPNKLSYFPGIDYSNIKRKDFTNVRNFQVSNLNRKIENRLPWHDIAVMVEGAAVKDLARHFIQYWNFASYDINSHEQNGFMVPINRPAHENIIQPHLQNFKQNLQDFKVKFQGYIKDKISQFDEMIKKNNSSPNRGKADIQNDNSFHSLEEDEKQQRDYKNNRFSLRNGKDDENNSYISDKSFQKSGIKTMGGLNKKFSGEENGTHLQFNFHQKTRLESYVETFTGSHLTQQKIIDHGMSEGSDEMEDKKDDSPKKNHNLAEFQNKFETQQIEIRKKI